MGIMSLVQYQITSLVVLLALAVVLIVVCSVLSNKIFGKRLIRSANKEIAFMNMDDDSEDDVAEGISLIAKRKYFVSNDNKVKPQVYTLIATDNTITVCINHINRELNNGDVVELSDGDTICSLDENIILVA